MVKSSQKKNTWEETFKVNGETLLAKVKELIREGNVRKITIKDKAGKEIVTFPLTIGVVGAVIAPILAAVGANSSIDWGMYYFSRERNGREVGLFPLLSQNCLPSFYCHPELPCPEFYRRVSGSML